VVSNAEEIPRLCPSRARRRPARSRGECPARQRAGCTRFPSTAVDRSVVFDVYLLVSGIAQAIAAFTVGVSPGSRVWLFISGAVSVALGYFAFRDFKQRRRRVDAGHMDRRWIHIPRCHGDRIGDRCSSTARAGLVRVRRDPDCDRRRLLRGRPVHRRVPALPCRAAQPPGRRDRLSCSCHVDRCFGARILT